MDDFVFARLTPVNQDARLAFHEVVVEMQDPTCEHTTHHKRFLNTMPSKVARRLQETNPVNSDSEFSDSAPSSRSSSHGIDSKASDMIWTGSFELALERQPHHVNRGWAVGRGRWSTHTSNHGYPVAAVDLRITSKHSNKIRGVCAHFSIEPSSGLFFVVTHTADQVWVNGTVLNFGKRALNRDSVQLRFGSLDYQFQYTVTPEMEKAFQARKSEYIKTFLQHPASPPSSIAATPSKNDIELRDWVLRAPVGSGAFGVVSAAINHSGRVAAVKDCRRHNKASAANIEKEIGVYKQLEPLCRDATTPVRVLRMIEVFYQNGNASWRPNVPPDRVWILLEPFVRATFADIGKTEQNNSELKVYFKHILEGLKFLHDNGWVHRDIKPGNLGVVSVYPPRAVILDLGNAQTLPTSGKIEPKPGWYGTITYLAPEMETEPYDMAVDIWALGIVGYQLFYSRHPWSMAKNVWLARSSVDFKAYQRKHRDVLAILKSSEVASIDHLLAGMLYFNPEARTTAGDALGHNALNDSDAPVEKGTRASAAGTPVKRKNVAAS